MNERLLAYLRSLGLTPEAAEAAQKEFVRTLRGVQATIANLLDYAQGDEAARTSCDCAIRALGYDPEEPIKLLPFTGRSQADPAPAAPPATQPSQYPEGSRTAGAAPTAPNAGATGGVASEGERQRVKTLRELARDAGVDDETLWKAIEENHTVERASADFLAYVRRQREGIAPDLGGSAPAGHSRSSVTGVTAETLVAALMIGRGEISDPTQAMRRYDPQTGEFRRMAPGDKPTPQAERAADEGYRLRGLSMVDYAHRCLELDGVRCERTLQSVLHALNTRSAGMGTSTLLSVFTQMFGAVMLASYERTPDTTEGWTRVGSNPNFFRQERHRLGKMGALTKHAKGGTADTMDTSDETAYAKIHRYTGKFAIDEMDLINDTFGALNQYTPAEMGASAKTLAAKLIYFLLMSNPQLEDGFNLFSAEHNNLATGVLNKENLQKMITLIDTQQEQGEEIDLVCRYLIGPRDLRYTLKELVRSATVVGVGGGDNALLPSYNALEAEDLQVVTDSRLDNGVTDPNTGARVAGDVNAIYGATRGDGRTIEKTYLRGSSESPEVRSGMSPPGSGEWAMNFDVKQDIGGNVVGFRGMAKLTGT